MKIYFRSKHFFFLIFIIIILASLLIFVFTSCKDKTSNDSTSKSETTVVLAAQSETTEGESTSGTTSKNFLTGDNTGKSLIPFGKAASWGPLKTFKGNVEDLNYLPCNFFNDIQCFPWKASAICIT